MPKLDTMLHVEMLRDGKRQRTLGKRIKRAVKALMAKNDVYGLEWGDPEQSPPLRHVLDHFLRPYVAETSVIVEIGPGGGRWTRYLLPAKQIYAVDYHQELLDELRSNFASSGKLIFVKNDGDNFPGVPEKSVDFIFSFGAFVHLDLDIIDRYLGNMKPLLKPSSNVVIHYSDKTKPLGQKNEGFSDNDPERMRRLVESHGYQVLEEDTGTMWHSSIIRFGL